MIHVDAYRLENAPDVDSFESQLQEYLDLGAILLIEWPQFLSHFAHSNGIDIWIDYEESDPAPETLDSQDRWHIDR